MIAQDAIRLTTFARCAGCAAKLGRLDLSQALAGVPVKSDPRLLVGRETFDDAGVFQVSEDLALVQTVDFFAPIVDDPYSFGQVAAANALSDVYAMGGEPLTALNIVGFPANRLSLDVLTDVLRGGQDKVHEAGALVVGGHTIIDDELKFGLSVTGRVDPKKMLSNANAKVGDRLVLTKPLGTAILATAAKRGDLGAKETQGLIDSMTKLNASAEPRSRRGRGALRDRHHRIRAARPRQSHRRSEPRLDRHRIRAAPRASGRPRRVGARRDDERFRPERTLSRDAGRLADFLVVPSCAGDGPANVGRVARGGACRHGRPIPFAGSRGDRDRRGRRAPNAWPRARVTLGGNEWGSGGGLVALAVFKTVCDLTFVGLGGFDSHALPPARRSDPPRPS